MVTMRNLPKTKSAKYGYGNIICVDLVAVTVIREHTPVNLHNYFDSAMILKTPDLTIFIHASL